MKRITRETVAGQLSAYLRHELPLANLVDWAESALMEGEFDPSHVSAIRDAVARIGVADVRAFGLTWEDCEQLLDRLGYSAHVSITAR
ncbi:hypothetical protein [Nitrospira moscoviensis]|jgi:cobyrinic acid a,c-diamide synthase|uniref:Uncharacterized protein n=1 Tax=Nitrospira moscoviensis TaxID=42253 RepID=A0A0K2GFG5_NITMO|nr:hypothetical protein [Nitrospira moscoviensis]ALA59698.1 hypothetical protein NITMOv2_3305 [Nitrospira moscoviensis]